ncbi:phenol monooxygenase [Hyaloscypha bicolor E]|uniref:Phenol monooxygenase n=1 Tax=Hyaloscypha bicolor E TaxID=1095630 RepID=A0A2J6STR7_9HELO|nr:phenol monooxygenase [Hyaloscypha bicolor E]PMD54150.1 phenol monooxygenase [Hyaloscypha bicolor E]
MPVFTEYSQSSRDLRVLPSFATPLPRLSPKFEPAGPEEKYEVVIAGAGPAGLFLEVLLARYGLTDSSLLCIDSKPTALKSGQADGLQPRTLEVLGSLGLVEEILTQGCQMWEVAFWNPKQASVSNGYTNGEIRGIERTSIVPDVAVAARFPHEVTIHQGRIERILEDDLKRYSARGVQRSSRLTKVLIDEAGDPDFPVLAEIESPSGVRTVRMKHLVGADGAHSLVRRSMGLKLQGETSDFIWGVVDLIVDTDFPDIRRRCAIHSDNGSVMVIPRERIATGEYLTRLYVHVQEEVKPDSDIVAEEGIEGVRKSEARARREKITMESILEQAQEVLKPYYIKPISADAVDWWAAYQIGQRVSERFVQQDSKGVNRVFIVGDACHTHSPKAGQGMNVSMMDSYNLSWKLIHSLHGLTPASKPGDKILDTFETERQTIAQELIAFDKEFSSMFSGKIGAGDGQECLTHEQFLEVFSTGNGFTSGCGIEYPENLLVEKASSEGIVHGRDYLSGILRPGRRLLNVKVKRHTDGARRDLQDDFPSTGRFRILCFTSADLLTPTGISSTALTHISTILTQFPAGIIESVVLHPLESNTFVWSDIPKAVKTHSEMRFYNGTELENAYKIYGVDPRKGAIAVVRPDGYIGTIAELKDIERVWEFLKGCLRTL